MCLSALFETKFAVRMCLLLRQLGQVNCENATDARVEDSHTARNLQRWSVSLFRHWLGFAFAGLLLAVSLPFLSAWWLLDRFGSRSMAVINRTRTKRSADWTAFQSSWADNEFCFEQAIEKYEELIDRTARRQG
jgi:hypothetical protein